jgi:RND family efflux transporter MFP subunit
VNRILTIVLCLLMLLAAAGVTTVIFLTEPTADRVTTTRETAMLVEVAEVEYGTFQPEIAAMGMVVPEQDIILRPRVAGEIVNVASGFTPGGFVEQGEILIHIDPADYEMALLERQSALREAEAALAMELGRQDVAKQDYELLGQRLDPASEALVLRRPQLDSARARVEAARAALRRAELDLERTQVRAPFDAYILERNANLGSQVSESSDLGRLVGVARYWVEATVPVSSLEWIAFPEDGVAAAGVRVRDRTAWPQGIFRSGSVHSLIAALDQRTRLARLLVTVPDPLARQPGNAGLRPLIAGAYVETLISGRPVADVVRIPRDHLRQNDRVWLMVDGQLRIRDVEVVLRDRRHAYIRSGIDADSLVVTTNLSTVVEGAPLRVEENGE